MKCGVGQHKLKVYATNGRYIIRNGIIEITRTSENNKKTERDKEPFVGKDFAIHLIPPVIVMPHLHIV